MGEERNGDRVKLHLGCADKFLEGYQHMDIRKLNNFIDYIGSAEDLSQFTDNSIDEIYACHLLEHFKRHELEKVLREWYRVIKGGRQNQNCSTGF